MNRRNVFQQAVVTGRLTLPVAILIFLAVAVIMYRQPKDLFPLGAGALVAYLMIELNTRYALIRVRSMLPPSVFLFITAGLIGWGSIASAGILLVYCWMLFSLFESYERSNASVSIFNAFLCIGLSGLCSPWLLTLALMAYAYMLMLRSLSLRTFFAGLIGLITPYWLLGAWYSYCGTPEAVLSHFVGMTSPLFAFSSVPMSLWIVWGILVLLSLVSSMGHLFFAYQDKVQTRIYLRFFWYSLIFLNLLVCLHPILVHDLLLVQGLICSVLFSHFFSLYYSVITRILFPTFLIVILGLIIYELWILGFLF